MNKKTRVKTTHLVACMYVRWKRKAMNVIGNFKPWKQKNVIYFSISDSTTATRQMKRQPNGCGNIDYNSSSGGSNTHGGNETPRKSVIEWRKAYNKNIFKIHRISSYSSIWIHPKICRIFDEITTRTRTM